MTTMTTTETRTPWWKGPKVGLGLAAMTVVIVAVAAVAGLVNSDDAAGSPSATISAYVEAYNAGDIDGVMALFTDRSVISNHPSAGGGFQGNSAVTGIEAIRLLHEVDLAHAAATDAYVFSNVAAVGATVTWDHTWKSDEGLRGCGDGHEATVVEGKILSWVFGSTEFC